MIEMKDWKKSKRSAEATNCVEVGHARGLVGIRDTKNRDGGTLVVSRPEFDRFLAVTKAGQLI